MKKIFLFLVSLVVSFSSCDRLVYDELAELHSEIDALKNRMDKICEEMNTNISSLQTIVSSFNKSDYIKSIAPIVEDGVEIGYVITFTESGSVTIYHGKDGVDGKPGKDGHIPVVGASQGDDGLWYWTVDGAWVLDGKGNRIPTEGTLPRFKIEDDYWYVSYDNGTTWQKQGKAVGENGADGEDGKDGTDGVDGKPGTDGAPGTDGDAMFQCVNVGTDGVEFILADGTTFVIPFYGKIGLTFELVDNEAGALPGSQIIVKYNLTGASDNTKVSASSDGNYSVYVRKADKDGGELVITCPEVYVDGYVNVIVAENAAYYDFYVINFYENKINFSKGLQYTIPAQGGKIKIPYSSNFGYEMKLTSGSNWMSFEKTKAPAMVSEEIEITALMNMSSSSRVGKISFYPENSEKLYRELTITQSGAYYSIDQYKFAFPYEGGTVTANVKSSRGLKLIMPSDQTWLSAEVTSSSDETTHVVNVKALKNSGNVKRNATIQVYSKDGSVKLGTIELVQVSVHEENPNDMIFKVRVNYANDFTTYLPLTGSLDCYVDWGDGLVEYVKRSVSSSSWVSHKYNVSTPTSFRVKISGTVPNISSSSLPAHSVQEVEQWGLTGLTSLSSAFTGNTLLTKVPTDDGGAFVNVTNCSSMFNGCVVLSEIPNGLFDNCAKVSTFDSVFKNCASIKTIPDNLFKNCKAVTSFSSCFYSCSLLSSIPDRLFEGCEKVTSFNAAFEYCENLTEIPANIFKGCVLTTSLNSIFERCSSLEIVHEGLFSGLSNVSDLGRCFLHCDNLRELPIGLFDDQRKVVNFQYAIAYCGKLVMESPFTIIDGKKVHFYERANYPDHFVTPKNFSDCFMNSLKLTDYSSIPTEWK